MDSIKLEPYTYIHILDLNSNLTRLEEGPKTLYRMDHEEIVLPSTKMIKLPPKSCVLIKNPVLMDDKKHPVKNSDGTLKNLFGEMKIKTSEEFPDPFPLYPGEILDGDTRKYTIVTKDEALLIKVLRDYTDTTGVKRLAGENFQIRGPITYVNKIEEKQIKVVKSVTITKNQGLILQAVKNFKDRTGADRYAGEQWLYTEVGSFIPDVNETIVKPVKGVVLDNRKALHVQACRDFEDFMGVKRHTGDMWLVTNDQTQTYIEGVNDNIVAEVKPITLTSRQYCFVENPYGENGKPQWGKVEVRVGEQTFFLLPNEQIVGDIEKIFILDENDALILEATDDFYDEEFSVHRRARENWMIKGPREYIPNIDVQIKSQQKAKALDSNEGVYIRDLVTGAVRAVIGEKILLKDTEEFWDKEINPLAEKIIYGSKASYRNKSEIVTYPVNDNSVVQIYDFKTKTNRVVFGPEMVLLQPSEEFTVLKLSGDVPKRENVDQVIALPLGQANFEDEIAVETNDHASIILHLSYTGNFILDREKGDATKIFSIEDYVGIACKTLASRIRGVVSSIPYNEFHHNYSSIIKQACFGRTGYYQFFENDFRITECDVKNQYIKDVEIREKLKSNTSMAIELKTKANELKYELQRKMIEEESKGKLILQKLKDETRAADAQINLQKLKSQSDAIKEVGEKIAQAKASSEGSKIRGQAMVDESTWNASAFNIETEMYIKGQEMDNQDLFEKTKEDNEMLIERNRRTSEIEVQKFKQLVKAIGTETIKAMAKSGPENRAKLLKGLGLEGYLVTDGKTPVNLFAAASGLVANNR
jgi:major vault protein